MSMQAQAERERQARVILGESEHQIAEKFGEAAKTYADNPTALHLRAMNMLYEGLKENATIVLVPSSALDTMQLGGLAGMTSLSMGLDKKHKELQKKKIDKIKNAKSEERGRTTNSKRKNPDEEDENKRENEEE